MVTSKIDKRGGSKHRIRTDTREFFSDLENHDIS